MGMTAEPSTTEVSTSVYERIGGHDVVDDVVTLFYDRVLADRDLAPFFVDVDLARLRAHQVAFISAALGGPHTYSGRAMGVAHTGMGITGLHFDRVVAHLISALEDCDVPLEMITTLFEQLAPLRSEIVETT